MSDLSLALRISAREDASLALNSISKSLRNIEKQTEELNKNRNKSNQYWNNKDKREQEKHETWKTNLLTRETEKRIRLEERAARERLRHKENAKRQMMKTEEDFRSSAARMALYVTAPTALLATFGMRAYMEMEQRQIKMKMYYGKEAADMEKFAKEYAIQSAFTIQNTTSLLETIALGKEKLGIKSNQEVRELAKSVGDVVLAYTGNADEQYRVMNNIRQMMSMGRLERTDLKEMAKANVDIERLARMTGVQKSGEIWTAQEIIQIFTLASKTNEVLTNIVERSKTFTQAWDSALEINKSFLEGLGKTLNNQFKLTEFTKIYAGIVGKIALKLGEDNDNLAKGMGSYLTMLGLTVAPMLMLLGHWKKLSFLIGESNMKLGILKSRLFIVGSAVSALYLTSVDWKQVLKDIEENPMQGIIKHLDTAIALAFTLSGAFVGMGKAIDLLNKSLLLTNARLIAMAKSPVIRLAGLGLTAYDTITDDERIQKNIEKARNDYYGNNNPSMPLGNLSSTTANPKNIEMLANLQSQPNIEVVNNINVDKSGNVTVETKQKDKDVYRSPYTAPIISDFSLGY